MKHALLSAPPNTLSRYSKLSSVEYGLNVRPPRGYNETVNRFKPIDAHPFCNAEQFAGWLYRPSLVSLQIWLQSLQGVGEEMSKQGGSNRLAHLANLKTSTLVESFITEKEVKDALSHLSFVVFLIYNEYTWVKARLRRIHGAIYSKSRVLELQPELILHSKITQLTHIKISIDHRAQFSDSH